MKLDDMPSPGLISNGHQLRQEAWKAVSRAEVNLSLSPTSTTGEDLKAFFLELASKCPVREQPAVKAKKEKTE